jgi:hypothetical protein
VRETDRNKHERHRRRWEDNIKINSIGIECLDLARICLALRRSKRQGEHANKMRGVFLIPKKFLAYDYYSPAWI